jgi:glycosyltransferase involved in cell wall biosynthesis
MELTLPPCMPSRSVHASTDRPEPWLQPPAPGERERLRSRAPLVSVITPSYNQAAFLDHAIRSVLDQGYPHLEYIIVDGGSGDGSVDVIRRYADRLAFWVSEPDRGQANAVNKAMAHVTGDIVGWVNSDDFYYPGAIRAAVEAFADDPDAGFVYGRGNRVDEGGALIEPFRHTRSFDLDALTRGIDYILQPTVFMRRGALAEVAPLDPTMRWTLDWDLWIRLGQKFPARMFDHLTAASREYASTKTAIGGLDRIEEIRRFVRQHTGYDVSVGYLNYLMFALLDDLAASNIPERVRIEPAIHRVIAVCGDLLREPRPAAPLQKVRRPRVHTAIPVSPRARRALRAVVPFPLRRAIGRLLDLAGLRPEYR